MSSFDAETQRFNELDQEFEQKVSEMSSKDNEKSVRRTLESDELWKHREESKSCLSLWNENQRIEKSTLDSDKTFWESEALMVVLGAIIGASIAIIGTEKIRHYYLNKRGKDSIKFAILRLNQAFIEKKFQFNLGDVSLIYVSQHFSTIEYDGLISSGTFIYFKTNLQDTLNALYFQIKNHNRKLTRVEEFHNKLRTTIMLPESKIIMIENILELVATDNIMLDLIRDVEDELK